MQIHAPQGTARQFITITVHPEGAGGSTDTEVPSLLLNSQTVSSVVLSEDATTVTIRTVAGDAYWIVASTKDALEQVMRNLLAALEAPHSITLPPGAQLRGAGRL